jgi:hypothetical protein
MSPKTTPIHASAAGAQLVAVHAGAAVLLFAVALITSAPSRVSEPYRTRGNSKMGSSTEGKKTGLDEVAPSLVQYCKLPPGKCQRHNTLTETEE